MSEKRFDGRTALVTGGASGIGGAVTRILLEEGASVYVFDTHASGLEAADRLIPMDVDVSDVQSVRAAIDGIPSIDHVVNAAGVLRTRPIEAITEEDWDLLLSVNAKGPFFVTQACAPKITAGIGSVVNVSSVGAISAVNTDAADYHAAKTALLSITRSWARALAPRRVRVNAILPGLTRTPMIVGAYEAKAGEDDADQLLDAGAAAIPLARLAEPAEIAASILFLLSSDSSYMTGASMNVSGGIVMV